MPVTRAGLVIDGHLDAIHLRKPAPPRGERRIYLGDWTTVPIYDFERLAPEQRIAGPAIVESDMTAVLLRPQDRAQVTAHGWLGIAVPARGEQTCAPPTFRALIPFGSDGLYELRSESDD